MRRSLQRARLRIEGELAYFEGVPFARCPHRLSAALHWRAGWLDAARRVELRVAAIWDENGAKNGA